MSEENVKKEYVYIDHNMLIGRLSTWYEEVKAILIDEPLRKFSFDEAIDIFNKFKSIEEDLSWLLDVEWRD